MSDEKLVQRAKNVLLHQLSRSMKTEHQLRQVLIKREIPEAIADAVILRFTEAQLIDDEAFAKAFVASRIACGGKSKAVLRRELRQKGVSDEISSTALADIDRDAEYELALGLAQKRLRALAQYDPEVRRRRLQGFLSRRGFDGDIVRRAMASALASE
jgi:regulatory protein